ncbi:MAG TPA: DUF2817 domain-containing protein [Rhizomicrobium sp.]|nr:DUF2817 domain-containing protein [Rhizomicrobium sp.]
MSADLKDYRAARRAFIAACEKAGVDTIARVHSVKGADGKPLFMDSAALGPRLARKAVVAIAQDLAGSDALTRLLHDPVALPPDTRLVLVHAPDPAAFAGASGDTRWAQASLSALATEDLFKVTKPVVLNLNGVLSPLPGADTVPAQEARARILAEFATL